MGNIAYKIFGMTRSNLYRLAVMLLTLTSLVSLVGAQTGTSNGVVCAIVGVFNAVHTTIFILGLLLMVLGGALYAGSHVMPGQSKGTVQGYGMGMIMGGIIGVIIALLAPWILTIITGNPNIQTSAGGGTAYTANYGC